ncbi:hypothetical protein [Achromobacter denitrificans]|uniref:hypothetical protein n=1 Tax=Achromobacter denitrificans TaxID=32002 RepID=UPI003CFC7825
MTNQNNAAQPVLTDDEILHRWDAYVSEPSTTYPLTGADKIAFARAIESALLSKLRAPVADERAAFEAWNSKHGQYRRSDAYERDDNGHYLEWAVENGWRVWQARAALASAPVAVDRQRLRDLVDVVWNEATESTAVPDTQWADRLIDKVFPAGSASAPVAADAALWVQALPGHDDWVTAKRQQDRVNGYDIPLFTLAQLSASVTDERISLRGAANLAFNALHECKPAKGAEKQYSDAIQALQSALHDIAYTVNRTATPQQFADHLQREARAALASAPVAGEAREHIEQMAVNRYRLVPDGAFSYKVVAGDGTRSLYTGTKDSCLRVAAKLTEAFLDGAFAVAHAAPQASAEAVRNAALEEAAVIVETAPDYLQDSTFDGAARAIRAIKTPGAALSAQPGAQKEQSDE